MAMKINLKIENKHFFMFSAILVFLVGVGFVIGFANPITGVGHELDEINLPSCSDGQVLKYTSSTGWACGDDNSGDSGIVCDDYGYYGPFSSNTWTAVDIPDQCEGGICTYILTYKRGNNIKTEMRDIYQANDGRLSRDVTGTPLNKINGDTNGYRFMQLNYDSSTVGVALDDDRSDISETAPGEISIYTRRNNYQSKLTICYSA